ALLTERERSSFGTVTFGLSEALVHDFVIAEADERRDDSGRVHSEARAVLHRHGRETWEVRFADSTDAGEAGAVRPPTQLRETSVVEFAEAIVSELICLGGVGAKVTPGPPVWMPRRVVRPPLRAQRQDSLLLASD